MEQFNTIPTSGNWSDIAGILDANFLRCYTALVQSESLVGLSGSNFQGIYTSASTLPDMSSSGWALVGSSLSALTLYVYNTDSSEWGALNSTTYNFTDFTEFQTQLDALSSQVAQIGLKLGDLTELETTEKSNLVGAINEVKNSAGGTYNLIENNHSSAMSLATALQHIPTDKYQVGLHIIFNESNVGVVEYQFADTNVSNITIADYWLAIPHTESVGRDIIGNLDDLETVDKTSIVNALNEVNDAAQEIYEQVPSSEETINPGWMTGSVMTDGSPLSSTTRCRTSVLGKGKYRITPSSGYYVMFIADYRAGVMNSANFIGITYNYNSDKSTKEVEYSTDNYCVVVVAKSNDGSMSGVVATLTSLIPIKITITSKGNSKFDTFDERITDLEGKVEELDSTNIITIHTGKTFTSADYINGSIDNRDNYKWYFPPSPTFNSAVVRLKSGGKFNISIEEGLTTITFLKEFSPINGTVVDVTEYRICNDGETLTVPEGYEYFYVLLKTPSQTRHITISDLELPLKDYVEDNGQSIGGLTFVESNIIATTENKILKLTIEDNVEYLNYSSDYGENWTKSVNNIGRIAFVHWFSDGTCMIAGHTKVWTTKDFLNFTESTIYDYDGNQFVPNDYHFFSLQNNYNKRYYIKGEEVSIWCDYGVRSGYISRVWMASNSGTIVRCILKNNETQFTNGGTVNVRHFHMIEYDQTAEELWVSSGDSGSECELIKGIPNQQDGFDYTLMAFGPKFKFGRIWFDDDYVYATTDYDGVSEDVGLIRVNKHGPIDESCISYLTKIGETAISNYHKDESGYKFIFLDGAATHNGLIYIAPPFSSDFKKTGILGCKYVPNSIIGINDNGDVIVRCSDGFATSSNSEYRLSLNRVGEGVIWDLSASVKNSGFDNLHKVEPF